MRGGKVIPLKSAVDEAILGTHVEKVFVFNRASDKSHAHMVHGRDVWMDEAMVRYIPVVLIHSFTYKYPC
jgi:acyl-coenzyme A synthetase/AMP-(fatty) acid ligase